MLSCFDTLPRLDLNNIVRFFPATCSCGASVAQLVEKNGVSWVRIQMIFSEKSLPQVSLNYVVLLCIQWNI